MTTHPLPIAGKLAIKALVAKQLQTTQIHIQTWISAPVVTPLVAMSLCSVRSDKPGTLTLAYKKIKFSHYSTISYMRALTQYLDM